MADEQPHEQNQVEPINPPTKRPVGFISDLFMTIHLGGKMSEQGADKVGQTISEGLRFFLKAIGTGAGIAFIFYFLPYVAEFINAIKHG